MQKKKGRGQAIECKLFETSLLQNREFLNFLRFLGDAFADGFILTKQAFCGMITISKWGYSACGSRSKGGRPDFIGSRRWVFGSVPCWQTRIQGRQCILCNRTAQRAGRSGPLGALRTGAQKSERGDPLGIFAGGNANEKNEIHKIALLNPGNASSCEQRCFVR